jgi:hypothetical protein
LNSGLWVRRLLIVGRPLVGAVPRPASEVNDGPCPEKPDQLIILFQDLYSSAWQAIQILTQGF